MSIAADFAVMARGLLEIKVGEGMRLDRPRRDVEMLEQTRADQVRWLPAGGADTDIDIGFAEIGWYKLRMGIGHVQQCDISERGHVINIARFIAAGERLAAVQAAFK